MKVFLWPHSIEPSDLERASKQDLFFWMLAMLLTSRLKVVMEKIVGPLINSPSLEATFP